MKQKKILYLRTDLDAENLTAGGSVAHTLGVINGFKQLGYHIVVASSAMHDLLQTVPLVSCVLLTLPKIFRVGGFKIACLLSNLSFYVHVKKLLRNHRDIDFIYQRYSLLNFVGVFLSWRTKIPLVLEFNGSESWVDAHWTKNARLRLRWLVNKIEQINLKYAHTIVVVSQALKDSLIDQGISGHKILVYPNGVDVDIFDPAKLERKRVEVRASLGVQECAVFGFIGTFSYWHGIEIIGDMIPPIISKWPTARFLLIGDGVLKAALQQRLNKLDIPSDKVIFLGTITQHDARNYLAACDVFLCPTQPNPDGSRFFGSPTKLFEYMSLAKPIIASDIEQLSEVISPALRVNSLQQSMTLEGKIGILVSPCDSAGFIQAADSIMMYTMQQRNLLGENARKKVMSKYTWYHHTHAVEHWLYNN